MCAGLLAVVWASGGTAVPALASDPGVLVFENVAADHAADIRELPGSEVRVRARPGQRFVLETTPFSMSAATPLRRGQNIEATSYLHCPALPGPHAYGTHYGNNLAPGDHDVVSPVMRWALIAPHRKGTRTYHCKVLVKFHTTADIPATHVRLSAPDGTVRTTVDGPYETLSRWTLPSSAQTAVDGRRTVTTLGYTFAPSSRRPSLVVRQDAQLSDCKASSPYHPRWCPAGRDNVSYAATWVEAQARDRVGDPCGTPVRGAVTRSRITRAEHHRTVPNSLSLSGFSLPEGCDRLRLSLRVRHEGGDAVLVHGGVAPEARHARRTAYSHGFAYETQSAETATGPTPQSHYLL